MSEKQRILIIDDDQEICELVAKYLKKESFEVRAINTGAESMPVCREFRPNMIITELGLPDVNGFQICRQVRAVSDIPIIILSSRNETFDKVLSLELGADDYIVKPFDPKELIARVHAVLRRFRKTSARPGVAENIVSHPDLTINLSNYSVISGGRQIDMPPKELELFYYLAASPNNVFTREQLLDNIWGYEYIGDTRTVDVHIKRLREKLPENPYWSIATVWGIGYKFSLKDF